MADLHRAPEGQPLEYGSSRCESMLLNTHWVMVIMDQFTRRIIGFGVHVGDVDGIALCRMFNEASLPRVFPTT